MSKIQYYRYELIPKAGGKPREGALIHVDGGYADLCPLPEFGDATVTEQLELLLDGEPTALAQRSLNFAQVDAQYRAEGKSCLEDAAKFDNHALLPEVLGYTAESLCTKVGQLRSEGYRMFKIKVGRGDTEQEAVLLNALAEQLAEGELFRLDPNARFSIDTCSQFLNSLTKRTQDAIQFIEDPTPFDAQTWRALYNRFGIPIAADFEGLGFQDNGPAPYQVCIFKPTREPTPLSFDVKYYDIPIVVTSALDHPIGQMAALYMGFVWAVQGDSNIDSVAGIASHLVYEENPFSAQLRMEGSRLIPPTGTGWGFDELLEALPWTDLD